MDACPCTWIKSHCPLWLGFLAERGVNQNISGLAILTNTAIHEPQRFTSGQKLDGSARARGRSRPSWRWRSRTTSRRGGRRAAVLVRPAAESRLAARWPAQGEAWPARGEVSHGGDEASTCLLAAFDLHVVTRRDSVH